MSPQLRRLGSHARPLTVLPVLAVAAVLLLSPVAGAAIAGAEEPEGPAAVPGAERVSVASGGGQSDAESGDSSISADGRYVAFESLASNLVPGGSGGLRLVYVHDRQTDTTEMVSVSTGGVRANGLAKDPSISADGRYVAFTSAATNLVASDTNATDDVFVHDRQTDTTERVSVATGGTQVTGASSEAAISADGRHVSFSSVATALVASDTNAVGDVFVHDRQTDTTERVSVATGGAQVNGLSTSPTISADGRHVGFTSAATNLVASDTNALRDVFVHDRQTDTTERVSIATGGAQSDGASYTPSISADGRHVAFISDASNLTAFGFVYQPYVHDRQTDVTEFVNYGFPVDGANNVMSLSVSADGTLVAMHVSSSYFGDGVIISNTQTGTSEIAYMPDEFPLTEPILASEPAITPDGRFVALTVGNSYVIDDDTNGVADVVVIDRDPGATSPPVGQLRVTSSPAVPGQVVVDGVARDSWGLNWVEFPTGTHEVCFGPVPGFTPPPCEQVEVVEGQTTVVDGAYTQRGTLRVLTSPPVPSTITVDGAPANDWGVWTDLDPGTYEVCFGAVADLATPACQDAVVTAGAVTQITGVFTSSPGAPGPSGHGFLRATTDPAVASRVTIDGTPADSWGLTWLKLTPGTHEVCFEAVLYATAPDCQDVAITAGATAEVTGAFTVHGFLRVLTSPALPSTITVDGQPANAWGVWTSLEPGTYEVCFGDVDGFVAPACQDAVVTAGATTELTGTFVSS